MPESTYEDDDEPDFGIPHSIIANPSEYRVVELHYKLSNDAAESYLDLNLTRGDLIRRLRFLSPRQLVIEEGFPEPTHGMMIIDTSSDGLQGLGVRVIDIEASRGALTFWARQVIDLDATDRE